MHAAGKDLWVSNLAKSGKQHPTHMGHNNERGSDATISFYWRIFDIASISTKNTNWTLTLFIQQNTLMSDDPLILLDMEKADSLSFPTVLGFGVPRLSLHNRIFLCMTHISSWLHGVCGANNIKPFFTIWKSLTNSYSHFYVSKNSIFHDELLQVLTFLVTRCDVSYLAKKPNSWGTKNICTYSQNWLWI